MPDRKTFTTPAGREFFVLTNERGAATFQRLKTFMGWQTSLDTHTIANEGDTRHDGMLKAEPCEFVGNKPALCDGSFLSGSHLGEASEDEIFATLERWLP
jgi:hypothetical protein